MGQQALAQGDPEGLVNENLRGPASNVLSGEEGGALGWLLDENLGDALLYCPSRTATVLPKLGWGGVGEEVRREAGATRWARAVRALLPQEGQ